MNTSMFNEAGLQQLLIASESLVGQRGIRRVNKKDSLSLSNGIEFIVRELLTNDLSELIYDISNREVIREKVQQVWNKEGKHLSEYMKRGRGLKIAVILFLSRDEYINQNVFHGRVDEKSMTKYRKDVFSQKIADAFELGEGASADKLLMRLGVGINDIMSMKMETTSQRIWTPYLR